MKKNTLQDLRDHLFETLEELRDPDKKLDVERTKLICNVSSNIINSAMAQVKFLNATGQDKPKDGFFDGNAPQPPVTLSGGPTPQRRLNGKDHLRE